jgi:hypothetical protein
MLNSSFDDEYKKRMILKNNTNKSNSVSSEKRNSGKLKKGQSDFSSTNIGSSGGT